MLPIGHVLEGKYRVTGVLGRGGMGVVYLAENVRVRRQVAIKVLNAKAAESEDALVRFEREAQAAGQIGSDHIVEVLDLGTTAEGDRFMVMEYLEGQTWKQRMKQGRQKPELIVRIFTQLLDGLSAAHAAGIIHRDLKPDNVFLQKEKAGQRDWVKILDFGISKFSLLSAEEGQVTSLGAVMGTPFYMSPEQARAASEVDVRSDLYSVGVMLYEALTGQVPFRATTFAELLFKIVFEPPPHPKSIAPDLDDGLVAIVLKGMDRDPALRFQSAAELQQALVAWRPANVRVEGAPPNAAPAARTMAMPAGFELPAPPPVVRDEPPDAPTQLWPGGAATPSPAMLTPVGDGRPSAVGVTQQTWDNAPSAAPKRTALLAAIGMGAALGVGAIVAVAMFGNHEGAPIAASAASAASAVTSAAAPATSASASADPVAAASTTATAEPAPSAAPSAVPSAEPASTARASHTPTPAKPKPPTFTKPASPPSSTPNTNGKVVTDYGY